MKKRLRWIIIFAVVLVFMTGKVVAYSANYEFKNFIDYYLFFKDDFKWEYNIQDFNTYKDDFEVVAEIAMKNVNSEEKYNFVDCTFDRETQTYFLYNYQDKGRIELTEKELESVSNIKDAFTNKDAKLDTIRVHKNRVSFCTNNGQYAVVYSLDDSIPTYVNGPEEKHNVFTKKICDKWYHVVIDVNSEAETQK